MTTQTIRFSLSALPHDTAFTAQLIHRLQQEARAHRSDAIARFCGTALQALGAAARRAFAAYCRRRDERATLAALDALDASTLRDLGLHRSELLSVAAELSGEAYPTRARVLSRRRQLNDRAYLYGTPFRLP